MSVYEGYLKALGQDIELTLEMAEFVKDLRVIKGYSWRAVHRDWQIKYIPKENWFINSAIPPDFNTEKANGHQPAAMELCDKCMMMLGEEIEDGWN